MPTPEEVQAALERTGLADAPPPDPIPSPNGATPQEAAEAAERVRLLDFPAAFEEYVEEERRGEDGAMTFGWPTIDLRLGKPIRPGEVVVVGARTGVGKTWIAQHAVERKLTSDETVGAVDFTMEMSAYQMAERMAGRAMQLSTRQLTQDVLAGRVATDDVLAAAPYLHRVRFFESSAAIDTIPEVIDLAEQQMGIPVGIVVIDYAQLLSWKGNPRALLTEQMTVNVRRLKDVTKEKRVITIACAQLSRGGGSGYTEPSMETIRESGAAEEASDRILLAWRVAPDRDEDGKAIPSAHHEIRVKVEKNRHGRSGGDSALIRYDHAMRMSEVDEYALAGQDELLDESAPSGYGGDDVPF